MASSGRAFQKVFVSNIPWTVGHPELRNFFREFGRVISASVVFDKNTGCSKGYGFVVLGNRTVLQEIERQDKLVLEGQIIQVRPTD